MLGCFECGAVFNLGINQFANYPVALYEETNIGERIATNLLLIVVIASWTLLNGVILFGFMKFLGILRVSEEMERSGIDIFEHGGSAVNMRKTYSSAPIVRTHQKKQYLGFKLKSRDSEDEEDDLDE